MSNHNFQVNLYFIPENSSRIITLDKLHGILGNITSHWVANGEWKKGPEEMFFIQNTNGVKHYGEFLGFPYFNERKEEIFINFPNKEQVELIRVQSGFYHREVRSLQNFLESVVGYSSVRRSQAMGTTLYFRKPEK